MIDTTCPTRVLHFAKTNYKYNFDVVKLESDATPAQAYKAPGAFGEKGDGREYTFLMYRQPRNREIDTVKVPAEGQAFDVKSFQTENGLSDAVAGVGMVVKLGGQADCDGAGQAPPKKDGDAVSSSAKPPAPSSAPAASSSSAAPEKPKPSPPAPVSSSAAPAPSKPASSSAAPAPSSPSSASSPATATAAPSSSKTILTPAVPSETKESNTEQAERPSQTEAVVIATSVVVEQTVNGNAPGVPAATSTVVVDAPTVPAASGNSSATGPSPALQTVNAAKGRGVEMVVGLGGLVLGVVFAL